MKKLKLLFLVALSSALLVTACGKEEEPEAVIEAEVPVMDEVPTSVIEETIVEEVQEEVAEEVVEELPPAEGMAKSPLTNEWVDAQTASLRPMAVMVPNDKSALPHYNLSHADVLYECLVEGKITRLMAVFGNWTNLERVGNIRSCRDYFVYWAFEWDAIYIHAGGPFYIDQVINRSDTHNINALTAPGSAFYRTTDRSAPQNLYLNGANIYNEANRLGYPLQARASHVDSKAHFQFASASAPNTLEQYPNAANAIKIDLAAAYPITQTWFEYNPTDGLYYRYQKPSGGAHIDKATGNQLAFKNVLIQFTYHEVRDAKGYLAFQCVDSTRDGWYFTNGKAIHVNWKKTSDYGTTRYYDDNGNEIQLNTGKTMICIVQDKDTFNFES